MRFLIQDLSMRKTVLFFMILCGWQLAVAKTTVSTVSGAWYDPLYDGSGFNMVEVPGALFVYFYGYKGNKDGEAQWLLSKAIPETIEAGKTYQVEMVSGFAGNGGSFINKPTTPNSGTESWGTMELTFSDCSKGVAKLNGADGQLTLNIKRISKIVGLSCQESVATTPALIKTTMPSSLESFYSTHFNRYIGYIAPNGKPIHIVAQSQITDEQMLRSYNILKHYLTNYSGSKYGIDKSAVANAMANNNAILALLNGQDDGSNPIAELVSGQPLYQNEIQVEGHDWYMTQDYSHRDASYEEILHFVHDNGIGVDASDGTPSSIGALPAYQAEIRAAQRNGLSNQLWGIGDAAWINELTAENSLSQEYLASVVDAYYGLWGAWTGSSTHSMWGIYVAKSRADMQTDDPMGYALMENKFFQPYITYNARIDAALTGNFSLKFDTAKPYTNHSRYLKDITLLGSNPITVTVNELNNDITGNTGTNTVIFSGQSSEYVVSRTANVVTVNDTVPNRDGNNSLRNVERLKFSDQTTTL